MPLSPGTKLGPYEILAPIGAGGMGEVYKARDTRLDRLVAIKMAKEHFSERFGREARAVAALSHLYICTLYDVGPNYLVMEYIEGSPLGPLPANEALTVAVQIAAALEAAHAKGIVHRDLKPANVLLTSSGVKLLDFGLAKMEGRPAGDETVTQTQAGTVLGTTAYMSPEQAQGKPVDARSDIFSFGAVLYEVLCGRRAFVGSDMASTFAAILRDEPAPLEIQPEIQSILSRCLRKQPSERFQTATELKAALELAMRAYGSRAERTASIAVLPFANLSSDKENEYFSDGLAEEILNALTQVPDLRVIARASAFAFRGREHAIGEIAYKLRVTSILHGSVRRAGNRIRVTAQLINASDETQLWSERYDREMHDIFEIQDQIAQAIVEKLKIKLGNKAGKALVKRYTENLEAHSLYLKGNFHLYRFTPDEMQKGRDYLEQTVALEPAHAPAWVQLADYYIANAFFSGAPPLNLWPRALEAARKAVTADAEFAEGQAVLGFTEALSQFEWIAGLRRLDLAVRLNPVSARSHFWRGCVLNAIGKTEEALTEMKRAVDLDPLSPLFSEVTADRYLEIGQYEQAIEYARHVLDVDPNYGDAMGALGEAYSLVGRHPEGIALLEQAQQRIPGPNWNTGRLGWAYVRAGRPADARRFLAELEAKGSNGYVAPTALALAALALGETARAFTWLDQAVGDLDPNLQYMMRSSYFRTLQADHRHQAILRRMKLDRESLAAAQLAR